MHGGVTHPLGTAISSAGGPFPISIEAHAQRCFPDTPSCDKREVAAGGSSFVEEVHCACARGHAGEQGGGRGGPRAC